MGLPPESAHDTRRLLVPLAEAMSGIIGALLAGWGSIVAIEGNEEYYQIDYRRLIGWVDAILQNQSLDLGTLLGK